MKKLITLLFIAFYAASSFAQDNAIQAGEKVAVTFFDFDFAAGFWGEKSRTVKIGEEEKKIRQNPAQAGSAMISKVFGALR